MPQDIRARISAVAAAKQRDRDALWLPAATAAFDRILPIEIMEQHEVDIDAAFTAFIDRNRHSWGISVGAVSDMMLPFDLLGRIGCWFPAGVAMRFSQLSGPVRVLDGDDPYCAIVYVGERQRAYWVSRIWFDAPGLEPLGRGDLTTDRVLERLHAFAARLQKWEHRHPPVSGFEPYPRFSAAA